MPAHAGDPIGRFLAGAVPGVSPEPGACWLWTGFCGTGGYGYLKIGDRNVRTHRFAYALAYGDPGPLAVLHRCDNPPCWRPSHLFAGTVLENNRDRDQKGRQARGSRNASARYPGFRAGARNGNARLTEDDVRAIRRRYAAGGISQTRLAREFNCSQPQVSEVIRRVSWASLDDEDR